MQTDFPKQYSGIFYLSNIKLNRTDYVGDYFVHFWQTWIV